MTFISDPADDVSVNAATCSGLLNPGDDCTLTCMASGGNPQDYSYAWRFKHMYEDRFEAVTGATSAEFLLQSAMDSDAGMYECMVTNAGGVSSAALDINVNCQYHYILRH